MIVLGRGDPEVCPPPTPAIPASFRTKLSEVPERVSKRPEWPELLAGLGLETIGGTKRARGVPLKAIAAAA